LIDKELEIFNAVAKRLREKFTTIYVVNTELLDTPPKFPAVSFVQSNNAINNQYSTFGNIENVVKEDYKAEIFSNLSTGEERQAKEIASVISDAMNEFLYERTFCEFIPNGNDATICRRVSRYTKNNVI
jgi:hypothetical protein